MLFDCRDGNIDLILTKSISRFARNTVTLLETVRELKTLEVAIYFEEQKWRIRKFFEEGRPWNCTILGYRYKSGQFMIIPEEADIVRAIFSRYLSGAGASAITKELNEDAVSTRLGYQLHRSTIVKILKNYAYTGNLILQKTYGNNQGPRRYFH
jgi:DNA invertase Pin-like site-specific DNA recombinase